MGTKQQVCIHALFQHVLLRFLGHMRTYFSRNRFVYVCYFGMRLTQIIGRVNQIISRAAQFRRRKQSSLRSWLSGRRLRCATGQLYTDAARGALARKLIYRLDLWCARIQKIFRIFFLPPLQRSLRIFGRICTVLLCSLSFTIPIINSKCRLPIILL